MTRGACHPGGVSERRYTGRARGLATGSLIVARAVTTSDPVQTFAEAWREAETSPAARVPFIYLVAAIDGGHTVIGDVGLDGAMAWRACDLMHAVAGGHRDQLRAGGEEVS